MSTGWNNTGMEYCLRPSLKYMWKNECSKIYAHELGKAVMDKCLESEQLQEKTFEIHVKKKKTGI